MRLQRRLLRSGAAFAGAATAEVASVFGLTLAFVFAAAIGGPALPPTAGGPALPPAAGGVPLPGCGKSGAGAPSTTRAARTGLANSGFGTVAGEFCVSTRFASADAGGVTAGFEEVGAKTDSVDAGGIFGLFGSVGFVATKIDAMPSTITPMKGRDH